MAEAMFEIAGQVQKRMVKIFGPYLIYMCFFFFFVFNRVSNKHSVRLTLELEIMIS